MSRASEIQGLEEQIQNIREQLDDVHRLSFRGGLGFLASLAGSALFSYGVSSRVYHQPSSVETCTLFGFASYAFLVYGFVFAPWREELGVYIEYLQSNLHAYEKELKQLHIPTGLKEVDDAKVEHN